MPSEIEKKIDKEINTQIGADLVGSVIAGWVLTYFIVMPILGFSLMAIEKSGVDLEANGATKFFVGLFVILSIGISWFAISKWFMSQEGEPINRDEIKEKIVKRERFLKQYNENKTKQREEEHPAYLKPLAPEITEGCDLDMSHMMWGLRVQGGRTEYEEGYDLYKLHTIDALIQNQFEEIIQDITKEVSSKSLEQALEEIGPAPIAAVVYRELNNRTTDKWHHLGGKVTKNNRQRKGANCVASYKIKGSSAWGEVQTILDFRSDLPGIAIEMHVESYLGETWIVREFEFPRKLGMNPSELIPFIDKCYHEMACIYQDCLAVWQNLKCGAVKVVPEND